MKWTNIAVITMTLLLLAACTSQEPQQNMADPFIGGNVGMNLYLQNGLPPPTVFDGGTNPFAIGVVLENIGEYDIDPTAGDFLLVRLEGLLPANFDITDADLLQYPNIPIRGAQKNFDGTILPGEVYNVIYQPLNFLPDLQGNQPHTFRVTACYDYENYATTMLCMKDDVLESAQDSTICTLTGEKPVMNSGGPIHVTKVIQNPMEANRIQVNFVIEHVGTGEFYGRDADETCDPSSRNMNKYNVDVAVTVDDPAATLTCYRLGGGNSGTLTLYQGAPQTVTCILDGSASGSRIYQEAMNIELKYRYGEFIEDQFIVQAVPN